MRAFLKLKMAVIAVLLGSAAAFGQAAEPATTQQPAVQPPAAPAPAKPPARPSTAPQSVAEAARASKEAKEAAPPAKVYRNKDVKDPAETAANASSNPASPAPATTLVPSHPAAQTTDQEIQKDRAFEAQAKVFKSQILVEKGKIVAIQNRMASLKYQFDAWSTGFSQDGWDAQQCWTSAYYTPYYKEWCDTGRNLKAQYDATQVQLNQEKARLEQMQEAIRRKGYGNAVYDPD